MFPPCRRAALAVAALLMAFAAAPAGARAADPVVMAAGDIACAAPGSATPGQCSQTYTSNLALLQKAGPEGLAALLALGDLQYDRGELVNFQRYFGTSWARPELRSVLRPVPGNHEYDTAGAAGYFAYFPSIGVNVGRRGEGWYSFDVGAWHLVGLNSSDACGPVRCDAGSAQAAWLRADLAATQKACVLAFWHHPIATNPRGRDLFATLYSAGVEAVLVGHAHTYRRNQPLNPDGGVDPNGPREFVVGTGGHSGPYQGVLKMTLRAGSMDYRFVGEGPSDSGTVACRGGAPPPPPPPPPPRPAASFTVATSGLTARFTDTSTNTPTSWTWDFGDGTRIGASDPTPDPVHTYARAGTYTVRMTAVNRGGSTSTSQRITVAPAPAAPPAPPVEPVPPIELAPPVPPPPRPPVVEGDRRLSRVSTARARSIVRRAALQRLRRWRLYAVQCRTRGERRATCGFRARRGARRVRASGTITLSSTGRSLGFRFTVRYVKGPRRTTTWTGRARA